MRIQVCNNYSRPKGVMGGPCLNCGQSQPEHASYFTNGKAERAAPIDWLQRLGKWRMVFTGWQLGTRPKGDPEGDAVRDHRELSMALRADVNALTALLISKRVFTAEEYSTQLQQECEWLCNEYERRFPGFKAKDYGMEMQAEIARDTTAGWRP